MPDALLARRLKRSVETVRTRRAHKGIRVFNPQKHCWTAEDEKLLGLRPDAQVAMLLGVSEGTVRHRRNQLRISLPAGLLEDQTLARRLGCTVKVVQARRAKLGVPAPRPE
jgi:hypothetical protein